MSVRLRLRGFLTLIKITSATLGLLIALLLIVPSTETGSYWLLRYVLTLQQDIDIAEIDGTLLRRLTLRQLHYHDSQGLNVALKQVVLQWRPVELLHGRMHIQTLRLKGIDIKGQANNQETAEDIAIPAIPITIRLDNLSIEDVTWRGGNGETRLDRLTLTANLKDNRLDVSNLSLAHPLIRLEGHGSTTIQRDWPLNAELNWSYSQDQIALQGHTRLNGNKQRYQFDNTITGAIESRQSGFIGLAGATPEFNLNGGWRKLQWPLTRPAQIHSENGILQLHGTPEHYRVDLHADIAALDRPPFPVELSGNGNLDGLTIERMQLQAANSRLELSGAVNWQAPIGFDLALTAEQLNPADFGADVPGRLNIKLQSQGKIDAPHYQVALQIEQLTGKLFDQALHGEGRIELADQHADIDRFRLSAGDNHLYASGKIGEQQTDLELRIDAKHLASAWPTLSGSLNGHASIQGSLQQAQIQSTLEGRKLRFADYRIANLSLQAEYAHGSQKRSSANISARNLRLGGESVDSVILQASGSPSHHDILLRIQAPSLNLNLDADGGWRNKRWQAQISQLSISHPQFKQWRLASPAELSVVADHKHAYRIELANSCLTQNKTRLCVSAHGSPNRRLDGTLALTNWPLTAAEAWLPQDVMLNGELSAQGRIAKTPDDFSVHLGLNLPSGLARFEDEDHVVYEQPITASNLTLNYQRERLQGHLHLGLGRDDHIEADMLAGAPENGNRPLSGRIRVKIADMQLIDSLLPEISRLKGLLSADFKLGGNLEEPHVIGAAQWRNGRFEIPRLGTKFDNIQIKLDNDANHVERLLLSVSAQSGSGNLTGQGQLDLQAGHQFPLQLALTGQQFQILRLPEAEVAISPNLNIHKYDDLTRIDGLINIDKARVELNTLPESAIAPSADEVIVDSQQTKRKTIDPTRLNARIGIDFGDHSHFSGFGLKTRLAGKLEYLITQERQRMQGKADMQDASYRAYGQDLKIRKGEFLFNGPADNPWLTIEATRKAVSDDVTAILQVTGPLKAPQTKVYTEPSLPESEALSYLVTGKSTQWLGKGDSAAVANAAFNYGAGELSWLSDRLGIDEFEFEQGDTIQDSAVRLGQYLNPDLYVGVSMGLFASEYAADLKYRLSEHFSISTRAGESQRIDLKYQLETD